MILAVTSLCLEDLHIKSKFMIHKINSTVNFDQINPFSVKILKFTEYHFSVENCINYFADFKKFILKN